MLLTNPKQQRTLAEIVASTSDATRVEVAARLARVSRLIEEQQRFDAAVAASLDRLHRTKQLLKRIRRTIRG